MRLRAQAAVAAFLLLAAGVSGLECHNGTEVVECELNSCWSNNGSQYGCGDCPDLGTAGTQTCTVCATDRCNTPDDEADMSTTWRWLVLFLFFFLALILGVVVIIHFQRNGCKGGGRANPHEREPNDVGQRATRNEKRRISVNDRDINQWRDLEVDLQ